MTDPSLPRDLAVRPEWVGGAVHIGGAVDNARGRGVWPGEWVASRLGVRLADGDRPGGVGLADLVGLAVRRNPRRAHLLVSTVLGKHVPTDPRLVHGAGLLLGRLVRETLTGEPLGEPLGARPGEGAADAVRCAFAAALGGDRSAAVRLRDLLFADPYAGPACGTTGGTNAGTGAVVIGYAETATALGHSVADAVGGAYYLHSTRRHVPGVGPYGRFEEEHSHATSHLLLPAPAAPLDADVPLVLVDDELTTGATVINTLRALHAARPRGRYVVAALVDLRAPHDRESLDRLAAELGARIDAVALASGSVRLPADVVVAGARVVAALDAATGDGGPDHPAPAGCGTRVENTRAEDTRAERVDVGWPAGLPDGGRHGFTEHHQRRLESELPRMAGRIAEALPPAGDVLVLGFEELMYAPLRLAAALADLPEFAGDPGGVSSGGPGGGPGGRQVRYSTTTRSPVLAVDAPGYAIRTRLAFPAHDDPADGPGERYAYNVAPSAGTAAGRYGSIVLVVDEPADTPELAGGLLRRLTELDAKVLLVTLPSYRPDHAPAGAGRPSAAYGRPPRRPALPEPLRGPAFGSYRADDVAWLLKDLSAVRLEAPTEEREEAIQAGRAHYAESLPQEYQPGEEYQRLFHEALAASADRLARAVGVITEAVLAERGPGAVLVSLARAGTPIGVLMRRWAAHAHGLDLPHYAVSIVRGRGIDTVALRYLAEHHDPARVMFVDGWTGKGAITRELTAALDEHAAATGAAFPADLAVLADPGRCVGIYGTREDFLIPSACLNSTVSGLVSRTVLNADLIGPGDFHGAKFYAELAPADVSRLFLDTVCARFGAPPGGTDRAAYEPPDWSGWAAVARIGERYGITDLNLIKPGVGETTRVLLRRVPWKVVVRPGAGDDLAHVRLLAAERGVPVVEADPEAGPDTGPYACVGLIKPGFTRHTSGTGTGHR